MKVVNRLALASAACYLRRSPVPYGRWRLVSRFLPVLRQTGKDLGERVVRTRYGFRYKADLGDWLGQYVYLTGVYEPPTARVIAGLLRPGDSVVDVGANSGFFTLLASRRVGPRGRVSSFEPVPAMRQRLLDNIELNGMRNVRVHEVAVSDAEGVLPLFEGPEGHKGLSSLRPVANAVGCIEVRTVALDDLRETLSPIRLVKIDVEGAESRVLAGMARILEQDRPFLVIEITDAYLRSFGDGATALASGLSHLGYGMYRIDPSGLVPMRPEQAAQEAQYNALFAPEPPPPPLLAKNNHG